MRWLLAIAGALLLSLAWSSIAHAAEESNPNNYECHGHVEKGSVEPITEEPQVKYEFYCDGPITGYQLESNDEVVGTEGSPLVETWGKVPTGDTFSCSAEIPGWAVNCVGSTKESFERVIGQFTIETPICTEPRVNPLLTVTYAYIEKEVITQAISGPYELGRPKGCKADAEGNKKRLTPEVVETKKTTKAKSKKSKGKKAKSKSKTKASSKAIKS